MDSFNQQATLKTWNNKAMSIKNTILKKFCRKEQTEWFELVDICDAIDNQDYSFTDRFLRTLLLSDFPQSSMKLKVGMLIMLFRNIDSIEGLCNGTRLIVTLLYQNCIGPPIIGDAFNGRDYVILWIKLPIEEGEILWTLIQKQFLIRLWFAITINKSQGQSFAHFVIDLHNPCFSHRQFYSVGFWGQDSRRICVRFRFKKAGDAQYLMENMMYSEVLLTRIVAWKRV